MIEIPIAHAGHQFRDLAPPAGIAVEPIAQRAALDELHREERDAIHFAAAIDGQDCHVIQRHHHLRFVLEARHRLRGIEGGGG